jgi:predicted ATPase/class 3 adenylate cyclase
MKCEACGADNTPAARFCLNCGAGLLVRCSHCAADLPAGARFCPACGQPVASAGSGESSQTAGLPAGERKQVTVLFADFSGYTAFAASLDAEEVRDYMTSLWVHLDAVIIAHGGMIEKHIGDAIMAVFGARQAREDDPAQAVRAALAMQVTLGEMQGGGAPPPLQMRIGIHTGLVVVGPLGATGEFAATGDSVNLANRLEQGAPVGSVLISHDTYRQVYGLFDVQGLPPLAVKGKSEPLQAYLVLRAKPRAVALQLRGVEGVETEMIGRELELKRLQSALLSVIEERELRVLSIVGEAGIGKSRLLLEFQKWVDLLPQSVRLFCGRATAEMTGLPFSLIRDVFSSRFEILESDPPAVAREKLQSGLAGLLGAGADASARSGEELLLQTHFIGQLLGLDFSASPYLRDILNDTEQIRHRAFHYLGRFFAAVSQGQSPAAEIAQVKATLVVVEDAHWSDDGSLDLIDHLARTCQDAPLMIVCLTRSTLFERRPAWGEGLPAHTRLNLDPLSRNEGRALVETILRKAPEIPQPLRELIVGGAEGNPFYIEEIIKMLIDQKVIVPGAEQWRIEADQFLATRVPATLTGVLQARVDGLTPPERAVLQRASVVGRVFWDSAVERLSSTAAMQPAAGSAAECTLTKQEILKALAGLRRKELIFRRESSAFCGAVEYTFKHELLRNVAYESLLKKWRRAYHAQVAAWLIDHSGERIGEFTGLVAAHFEQAARAGEAAEWYGRAGQQARAGYAPATAINYFRKALELLPADRAVDNQFREKRMEWHEGAGEAFGAQARFVEALEAYTEMRDLAEVLGDLGAQARAWNGLAFLQERRGDNRASVEAAERAEKLARKAGESGRHEQIRALHLKGWAFYRLGDAPAVLALGEQTLKLCADCGDRRGMATSFKLHGVAHLQLGHYEEADRFFQQGLALCQEFGDRRNAAAMWSNLGESARLRGDYQAAAELYQKALAISRQIGHRESEVIYLNNLGGARLGLRQFEQAEADLRQVIVLSGAPKSCNLSETYSFLAAACLGQEKLAEALEAARHALALAQESENHLDLGGAWRALGRAAAQMMSRGAAASDSRAPADATVADPRVCFSESLRVFKEINAEGEQARTLRAWAEFELQQGQTDEGRKRAKAARDIFLRLGTASEVERTDALL